MLSIGKINASLWFTCMIGLQSSQPGRSTRHNPVVDFAIVGAGVVGLSIAAGLQEKGFKVLLLDEGDLAFRASRGNFGLVWVQGKGLKCPPYARWSRRSAAEWSEFAGVLAQSSGIDCSLQQRGGYSYHMTEQSLHDQFEAYAGLKQALGGDYPFEILGHNALRQEEPAIGSKVAGAILHHEDGHVNPLRLLRALVMHNTRLGAEIRVNRHVDSIETDSGGFKLQLSSTGEQTIKRETIACERVILSAGLGTARLGPQLGFKAPLRPQRGQVLITEKMPVKINRPSGTIRQVDEGAVQIGASEEEVGFADDETLAVTSGLAKSAIDVFPMLGKANLLRSWSALRVMSPDGLPIYQRSNTHRGAFMVTCHSGITLSAAHARLLPEWFAGEQGLPELSAFSEARFSAIDDADANAD